MFDDRQITDQAFSAAFRAGFVDVLLPALVVTVQVCCTAIVLLIIAMAMRRVQLRRKVTRRILVVRIVACRPADETRTGNAPVVDRTDDLLLSVWPSGKVEGL